MGYVIFFFYLQSLSNAAARFLVLAQAGALLLKMRKNFPSIVYNENVAAIMTS